MTNRNKKYGQGFVSPLDHILALREKDTELNNERDRRYAEVDVEREKALKIKEVADLAALELAREIQTYKDEKANQLREQIGSERGHYASKDELRALADKLDTLIQPITAWMQSQQGRNQGMSDGAKILLASLTAIGTILGIVATVLILKG